jgi:hypothetical protein
MKAKKTMTILLVTSLVVCWIVAGQLRGEDDVTPPAGQTRVVNIAGTWIGKFPTENSPYQIPLIVTETLTPIDLTGRFAYVMRMLNSDFTFTGMFPQTNSVTDLVGEAVRTGPDTYELSVIGCGVKKPALEDVGWADRGQIQYIWILSGSAICVDEDNVEHDLMLSLYSGIDNPDFAFPWNPGEPFPLHDQDIDDDGLPDEGEVPIFSAPFSHVSKRVAHPIVP